MTQEHLDAEVVAAWADGSIDPRARAAAAAHAADCTRCQAVLAAMIRTDPGDAEPSRGWLAGHIRWFVPLATAAAAAALWVGLSMDVLAPGTPPQVVEPVPAAADSKAATPAPVEPAQPMEASKREVKPEIRTRQRVASVPSEPPPAKPAQPITEKPPAAGETVVVDNLRRDALAGRPPVMPPAAATASSTPPSPPPPPVMVPTTAEPGRAEFRTLAESVQVGKLAAVADREFASPDLATRWRIGRGGAMQRSTDAGKTWIAQKSGVTLDLFAASAPSNAVCWVVGRSGVVLLTTDGATWRRVPFPEPADLRTVVATDARTATVTTLDGRVFRTFDGGVNWQR